MGLLAWLVWRVSPERLAQAAASLDWHGLALLTGMMVLGLYVWDVLCLRWLFGQPSGSLPVRMVGDARAASYVWSAFNYEAGQGVLAWKLAEAQDQSLVAALSRCFLLLLHDLGVLFTLGLVGWMIHPSPSAYVPIFLGGGLAMMAGAVLVWKCLPAARQTRIRRTRFGMWLEWWTWQHSARLGFWRLAYYGIILIYAALALRLCGIALDAGEVCGVIPLVMLADALPSVSGLGTRETALLSLLELDSIEQAVVMNLSLFWTAGLMTGRLALGLANWWLLPGLAWLGAHVVAGFRRRRPQLKTDEIEVVALRAAVHELKETLHEDAGDGRLGIAGQPCAE